MGCWTTLVGLAVAGVAGASAQKILPGQWDAVRTALEGWTAIQFDANYAITSVNHKSDSPLNRSHQLDPPLLVCVCALCVCVRVSLSFSLPVHHLLPQMCDVSLCIPRTCQPR
jgi:hypothetical protein